MFQLSGIFWNISSKAFSIDLSQADCEVRLYVGPGSVAEPMIGSRRHVNARSLETETYQKQTVFWEVVTAITNTHTHRQQRIHWLGWWHVGMWTLILVSYLANLNLLAHVCPDDFADINHYNHSTCWQMNVDSFKNEFHTSLDRLDFEDADRGCKECPMSISILAW